MSSVKELIAGQNLNAGLNKKTWGDIITNVKRYDAAGDGVTDDTNALQSAANAVTAGGTLWFPPGTYLTDGLTLAANTQVVASKGAVLKGRSGSGHVLTLANGCEVDGIEINGNKTVKTGGKGIHFDQVSDILIRDCYIHNVKEQGISIFSTQRYIVENNRIENCDQQAISTTISDKGRISNNQIDTCSGGIQWWGGDAAIDTILGIRDITITGNIVKNVIGGIWGSLGDRITVQGNTVESCTDVGIDFEGCAFSTAVGNTIRNCTNAAMSLFYGSNHVVFSANTVYQDTGNGANFKAYGTKKNTFIVLSNNIFVNKSAVAIQMDASMLEDCLIIGNEIIMEGTTLQAATVLDSNKIMFKHNKILVNGSIGLRNEGGNECEFVGNTVETTADSSSISVSTAGISLFWRSASFPAQKNTIKDNMIKGFVTSIAEDNWGDNSSFAWISGNRCKAIASHGTDGTQYKGQVDNNYDYNFPTTAISRTVI